MNFPFKRDLEIATEVALKVVHIRQQVDGVKLTGPQNRLMNRRTDRVLMGDLLKDLPNVDLRHPDFDTGAHLIVGATKLIVRASFTTGYMTGLTISHKKVVEEDGVYRVRR